MEKTKKFLFVLGCIYDVDVFQSYNPVKFLNSYNVKGDVKVWILKKIQKKYNISKNFRANLNNRKTSSFSVK